MVYLMIPPSTIGAIYYATEVIRFYKGYRASILYTATLDNVFQEKLFTAHLVKFLFSLLSFQFLFSLQDSAHISPDHLKPPLTVRAQDVQLLFNSDHHFIPRLLVVFLSKAPHLLPHTLHRVADEDGAEELLLVVDIVELPLAEGEDGEGLDLPLGLLSAGHLLSSVRTVAPHTSLASPYLSLSLSPTSCS